MTAEQEPEFDSQVALHEFRRASKHRARDATMTELRLRRDSANPTNSNDLICDCDLRIEHSETPRKLSVTIHQHVVVCGAPAIRPWSKFSLKPAAKLFF